MNKKTIKEILGEEFKDISGQKAINKIVEVEGGYVSNAFYKGQIGNITIFWGDERMGLCHIKKSREEQRQDFKKLLRNLALTINEGKVKPNKKDRWRITRGKYVAVIDSSDEVESGYFLLTAFEIDKRT